MQTFCRFWDRFYPSLHHSCCRNTRAASLGPCSPHGLERGWWSVIAVSPNSVVLETISPFFTIHFYVHRYLSYWHGILVVCSMRSDLDAKPDYRSCWILCTFTLLSNTISSVQRLIVRYKKKNRFAECGERQAVFLYEVGIGPELPKSFCPDALHFI
jgi:hypothetical protein